MSFPLDTKIAARKRDMPNGEIRRSVSFTPNVIQSVCSVSHIDKIASSTVLKKSLTMNSASSILKTSEKARSACMYNDPSFDELELHKKILAHVAKLAESGLRISVEEEIARYSRFRTTLHEQDFTKTFKVRY